MVYIWLCLNVWFFLNMWTGKGLSQAVISVIGANFMLLISYLLYVGLC